jgi:hypothetical protein
MTNPFSSWQVGALPPEVGIPVSMLVQSAVAGTVDDQITEHADDLFAVLDERGEAAWQEAAALLTQFILSGGHYGSGDVAADRYLAQQPAPSPELPVLTALHGLNAVCIRTSPDAAKGFLPTQPDWIVRGVTRYQFCVAAHCAGYPRERSEALLDELCADENGQRLT